MSETTTIDAMTAYEAGEADREAARCEYAGRAIAEAMIREGCNDLIEIERRIPRTLDGFSEAIEAARAVWFTYLKQPHATPATP